VKLNIEIDAKKIEEISKSLSNSTRIKIILELHKGSKTLAELHSSIPEIKYKDTIFRHVEILKNAGIVEKLYNQNTKKLVCKLKINSLSIEL